MWPLLTGCSKCNAYSCRTSRRFCPSKANRAQITTHERSGLTAAVASPGLVGPGRVACSSPSCVPALRRSGLLRRWRADGQGQHQDCDEEQCGRAMVLLPALFGDDLGQVACGPAVDDALLGCTFG